MCDLYAVVTLSERIDVRRFLTAMREEGTLSARQVAKASRRKGVWQPLWLYDIWQIDQLLGGRSIVEVARELRHAKSDAIPAGVALRHGSWLRTKVAQGRAPPRNRPG